MKPLFSLLKRGPWARPGKFFHGITEMKRDLRFGISFNRRWNTHVCSSCFHWEILFFFSFAKHPHYEWKCSSSFEEDPPREIFQDWRIFETEGDWTCFSNEDERILLLVWRRIFIFSSREYISTKIDRNGQVWRRVLAACTTIFFFFFFPSTLRSHTLAVKGG